MVDQVEIWNANVCVNSATCPTDLCLHFWTNSCWLSLATIRVHSMKVTNCWHRIFKFAFHLNYANQTARYFMHDKWCPWTSNLNGNLVTERQPPSNLNTLYLKNRLGRSLLTIDASLQPELDACGTIRNGRQFHRHSKAVFSRKSAAPTVSTVPPERTACVLWIATLVLHCYRLQPDRIMYTFSYWLVLCSKNNVIYNMGVISEPSHQKNIGKRLQSTIKSK